MIVLRIYKVLSYILLPIGAFFGFLSVLGILIALRNISLLLQPFLLGCTFIYLFGSYSFLKNGIINNKPCKHALLDWIRVNAIVSLIFVGKSIKQFIDFKSKPSLMKELTNNITELQNNIPKDSAALVPNVVAASLYFTLILSFLIIIHIALTFKLTKDYAAVFVEK